MSLIKMKPILYLRTSTKEQNPELQMESGVKFCKQMGLEEPEIVSEQGSAYKLESRRPKWESVVKMAKEQKRDVVVWKYDRAFRNREEFYKFIRVMFEVYKVKIYSVTEPSILHLWEMCGKTNTGNPIVDEMMNGQIKLIWNFVIQIAGEEAEEESRKKSERVKLAVRKDGGVTKSYKGKKWGYHSVGNDTDNQIIKLYKEGKTMRQIRDEVFYWNKNRNKKYVSVGYVHKIISKFDVKKNSLV